MKSKLGAALVAVSVVLTVATAQADPANFIGLQEAGVNGGAITIYTGPPTAYGTFFQTNNSSFVTGSLGRIPPLVGDTIDVSNTPGTLVVWMTATGNLASNVPIPQTFESSFTTNLLPDGWTVQVDTFLDPADGIFTTAIPLSSHLFSGSDPAFHQPVRADPGNGFYSVTARFTITASSVEGVANTTAEIAFIDPAAVPAPIAGAGLPGLILASGGLLGWWRRRKTSRQPHDMNNSSKALVKIGTAAIAMLPSVSTAWTADEIILTCGPASGYTYYMEGNAVKKADVGWKKDGVDGKIQLVLRDNQKVDIISSGPLNNFTYSGDGCTFSSPPMPVGKNELVIVAMCGRHLETFFFRWGDKIGEVVSVDIAATPISNRGGVLQAPCKVGQ